MDRSPGERCGYGGPCASSSGTAGRSSQGSSTLEALGPDVAILSEAPLANPRPSDTLTATALSWAAAGDIPSKGLALAGFSDDLVPVDPVVGSGSWSLATMHPAGFQVIGIWSCPPTGSGRSYGIEVLDTLDAHAESIGGTPTVVAGDFQHRVWWYRRPSDPHIHPGR